MTIVLLQNHRRKGNVFYLQPLESGYLPLSSYIYLNAKLEDFYFNFSKILRPAGRPVSLGVAALRI